MGDTKTIVEIRKMEEQLEAAKESAKNAFLASANDSIMSLKAIGFEYELKPVGGAGEGKNGQTCSRCGKIGHSKRTCKEVANVLQAKS